MFLFDMLAIASASYFSYRYFGLPQRFHIPTVVLTTVLGAIVLYLKSQYKIREFNVTKRNYYLLFEGVIFFNIVPFALLFFFVPKMSLVCYYALTMLLTYVALELYRFLFHYYLFNLLQRLWPWLPHYPFSLCFPCPLFCICIDSFSFVLFTCSNLYLW